MSEWLKFLDKAYGISERIIRYWKDHDTPRSKANLEYGREVLQKCLEHWFILRSEGIWSNATERILGRALQISREDLDSAVEKAYDEWRNCRDKDWSFEAEYSSPSFYMAEVKWGIENFWTFGNFRIEVKKERVKEGRGRPRKKHPIEKIRKLRKEGKTVRKIEEETGIPKSTVHRLLKT